MKPLLSAAESTAILLFLSPLWSLWALTLGAAGAVNVALSIRQRKWGCLVLSILPPLFGFFVLDALRRGIPPSLSRTVTALLPPAFLLFTALTVGVFLLLRHFRRTRISPFSIVEGFDRLSSGVCFFLDGGRCVLVNEKMRELCFLLTGHTLRSGEEFLSALPDGRTVSLPDGRVFSFTLHEHVQNGARLRELIASDVTEQSEKSERLRRENERLSALTAALRAYSADIGEQVRLNEILRAKMNIHDEMNRLLLQSQAAADAADPETLRRVLATWNSSALLLCRQAEEKRTDNAEKDLSSLASSLAIEVIYRDPVPRRDSLFLKHFTYAAREAMINAVKHARAGKLRVSFSDLPGGTEVRFENDGAPPAPDAVPRGGLADLQKKLEKIGGSLHTDTTDGFLLSVVIPKGEESCPAAF